jgi:hypothetical protein
MSLGTLALWIACFLLTYTFPLLNAGLGAAGSFLLYGVICAAGYLYILRNVPETKGHPRSAGRAAGAASCGRSGDEAGADALMAEEWILENAHLRMRVASLGGKVQSLFSRQYQAPVLYENPAGGMFPMLPLANRVAGNRFIFQGREIVLPRHHADAHFFFTATAGYSAGI